MIERQIELTEGTRLVRITAMGNLKINGSDETMLTLQVTGAEGEEPEIADSEGTLSINVVTDAEAWVPGGIPVLVAQASGDLKVRELHSDLEIGEAHGNLKLGEVGSVTVENVHGDLRAEEAQSVHVRGVCYGNARLAEVHSVRLEQVMGDVKVADVAEAYVASTAGNLTARDVAGSVTAGRVAGDAVLKDVAGTAAIDQVGGNLVIQDLLGGNRMCNVGGDLLLGGDLGGGRSYQFRTGGNAVVRLPEEAGAHLSLRAAGQVRCSLRLVDEERSPTSLSGRVGEGGPEITIEAGGDVLVGRDHGQARGWKQFEGDFDVLGATLSEAITREVEQSLRAIDVQGISRKANEEVARAMERLQAKLETVDWERIGGEAQRAVERAMAQMQRDIDRLAEKATRQQEKIARMAERQAERAQRMAERHRYAPRVHVYGGPLPPEPPRPPEPHRPSYDEERLAILKMVEEGQITPEQAELLFEALG